ncbi:Protein of unknown function DUF968 [uncultured Caudovirales phage]|uniref:Recombination enhancement, RecA-dependent nuclease n=1 Tax=uncultured Caudovirales phage TaxID=2100421 RepID=A0A6J5RVH5_9CAUD|nr:Protein of unknown function DUF968 [uncultured Caudovirales phage]
MIRAKPLPKALGKMLVSKLPYSSLKYRNSVKEQNCIACIVPTSPCHAHHVRSLWPTTMGRRVSDYLCVPLCDIHHDVHPGSLHKHGGEAEWWKLMGINPAQWIASFSVGGRKIISQIEGMNA